MLTLAISVFTTAATLSNKIRQKLIMKGIGIFGWKIKVSQFAEDTNLFCADMASAEQALELLTLLGIISAQRRENKSIIWLGNGWIIEPNGYRDEMDEYSHKIIGYLFPMTKKVITRQTLIWRYKNGRQIWTFRNREDLNTLWKSANN